MTTMSGPVDRLFPPRQPEPEPGCAVCATLDQQRTAALAEQDYSSATDCNVRMRAHPEHQPISR